MNAKFVVTGLFLVFIILSGFLLSRTGRPLNVLILTVHKLIAVGAVVYLTVTLYRAYRMGALGPLTIAAGGVTILFFAVMIATGGLLSMAKPVPAAILRTHQIAPYLVLLANSASLYLLLGRAQ